MPTYFAAVYVNVKLGKWQAWAFSQAARTGMRARELPFQETEEKAKERFAVWKSLLSDDWLYFGTVLRSKKLGCDETV